MNSAAVLFAAAVLYAAVDCRESRKGNALDSNGQYYWINPVVLHFHFIK